MVFAPIATKLVNPGGEQAKDGHFTDAVNARVPSMLLILNLCFVAVCVVSIILTFPGPDPTALNEKVIEKVTNASRRALSGFEISVFSQNQGKSMDKSHDAESLNDSLHEDAAEDLPL